MLVAQLDELGMVYSVSFKPSG